MLTIVLLTTPLVGATAAAIVERTRRITKLKVMATLPPGSEILEYRGDRSWWQVRVGTPSAVRLIEIEGGVHDPEVA